MPDTNTVIDCVPSPFGCQMLPKGALLVRTTLSPSQKVNGPEAVIVGVGGEMLNTTVTGSEVSDTHRPSVTQTVYVPAEYTVIDCVVSFVDHVLPVALLEVKVTLSPAQNCVGPEAVIVGVAGVGFTVTMVDAEVSERQLPSSTSTQ